MIAYSTFFQNEVNDYYMNYLFVGACSLCGYKNINSITHSHADGIHNNDDLSYGFTCDGETVIFPMIIIITVSI